MPHFRLLRCNWQHCTCVKRYEPGWNTRLKFKMKNENGAKKILVNRLIFVSYHLTSLDLFTRKLQFSMHFFVTTRPSAVCMNDQKNLGTTRHSSSKWRMRTEQIQVLLNMLNFLFSNTLLPLTSLPVTCKHVPLHATSLYLLFPDTIVPLTSSLVTCKHVPFLPFKR